MSGQQHAPAAIYPRERPIFTGGWVGPRTGLERCGKSRPHRDSIPDRPARSQSLYRLRYPTHKYKLLQTFIHMIYYLLPKAKFYQEKSRYNMSVRLCLQQFLRVICQTGLYTRAGKKERHSISRYCTYDICADVQLAVLRVIRIL